MSDLETLKDQYKDRFYRYDPWWTPNENRTVVFLSDTIMNNVFFIAEWNDYPIQRITTLVDVNDTICISGAHPQYNVRGGSYFVRLKPDFAISALLVNKTYQFEMHGFSMSPAAWSNEKERRYEEMELGRWYKGYIPDGRTFQDYRFLMVDMLADYNITIQRFPSQGTPRFFGKLLDENGGWSARRNSYQFASEARSDKPKAI